MVCMLFYIRGRFFFSNVYNVPFSCFRMVAPPGDRERSRISVMCQNYTQVRLEYVLPGGAFVPPPKVDAAVVSFLPLRTPYINLPFKFVERVVTSIFHGKKKNLSNTAKNLFPRDYEFVSIFFCDICW